jgi:protein-tyrosine-phosphatase
LHAAARHFILVACAFSSYAWKIPVEAKSRRRSRAFTEARASTRITMGCGDACPWVPARRREDWAIPDPKEMEPDEFRKVRDEIEAKVRALLGTLRESRVSE